MIAYQLIMQNNGELLVTSQGNNKGTVVKFTLEMESLGVKSNSNSLIDSQLHIEEEIPQMPLLTSSKSKYHSNQSRIMVRNQTESRKPSSSKQSLINFDILQSR